MNANELANELERPNNWQQENNFTTQAATMLRQQQALIENLNGRIERMIEKQSHYEAMAHAGGFEAGREFGMKQERERNNEPVAWISVLGIDHIGQKFTDVRVSLTKTDVASIPLYTHPVKEMSETRIKQIFVEQTGFYFDDNPADDLALMDFAKALLLEAQEK